MIRKATIKQIRSRRRTFIRSRIRLSTRFLKVFSQNKSNKQSTQVELRKTKISASSESAIEMYSIKRSMDASMLFRQLWAFSDGSNLWQLWGETTSTLLLLTLRPIFPGLPYSWAWMRATFSTRVIASSVLKEAIVFSHESCNIRSKLFARMLAISGLQADCSRASNKTEHSGCHK